jgi:transcriptional regulator with XRE-family HTH domain
LRGEAGVAFESEGPNTDVLMAGIGAKIKALRGSRNWTVEELARRSSVSMGLISQTERGRGNPSFNTLAQLAHALQVPVGRLFHATRETSPVVRASDRRKMDPHGDSAIEGIHELLTPRLDGALEAHWIEAPVGYDNTATPFSHAGEEFGLVLEGSHDVILDGTVHRLEAGDSITYDSTIPHAYRNAGSAAVKAVWVLTPPRA